MKKLILVSILFVLAGCECTKTEPTSEDIRQVTKETQRALEGLRKPSITVPDFSDNKKEKKEIKTVCDEGIKKILECEFDTELSKEALVTWCKNQTLIEISRLGKCLTLKKCNDFTFCFLEAFNFSRKVGCKAALKRLVVALKSLKQNKLAEFFEGNFDNAMTLCVENTKFGRPLRWCHVYNQVNIDFVMCVFKLWEANGWLSDNSTLI